MVFSPDLIGSGLPYAWDDGYPARIGLLPLAGPDEVTWIPVEPGYVFHVGGAHTGPDGRIVLDGCRYAAADIDQLWASIGGSPAGPAADAAASGHARLHRWTLDPVAGTAGEAPLDDRPVEFPTLDDRLTGRPSRHLYAVSEHRDGAAVVKYDQRAGTVSAHELGADTVTGEAVFVPADGGTAEDDGWLISITTTRDGSASRLLVLDATDVAGPPVAAVTLPRGVPAGFHGSWIPDE
jgi:carotenoid cleavage dioxygenase-like enzyme